jgi:hypothetical protein
VLLPTLEEHGVLDDKTSSVFTRLRALSTTIRLEPYVVQYEALFHHKEERDRNIVPIHMNIHGPDNVVEEVGHTLSDAGMFLQEPEFLLPTSVYRNPHVLSWDDDVATPRFRKIHPPSEEFFGKIDAILQTSDEVTPSEDLKQDSRIHTVLLRFDSYLRPYDRLC